MGILDSIMTPVSQAEDPLAEREKWLQMSQLFNSFTMNPENSRGYYEGQQKSLDRQHDAIALKSANELANTKATTQRNATAAYLRKAGRDDLAIAMETGALTATQALGQMKEGAESFKMLTPAQVKLQGLDPLKRYQASSSGKVFELGAGGTNIEIDMGNKADGQFYDELMKGSAKAINTAADGYGAAREGMNSVETLIRLGNVMDNNTTVPAFLRKGVLEGFSSSIDAYNSVAYGVAQSMRVKGSGPMTDKDFNILVSRAGSVGMDPEARRAVQSGLRNATQIKLDLAIAADEFRLDPQAEGARDKYRNKVSDIRNRPLFSEEERVYLSNMDGREFDSSSMTPSASQYAATLSPFRQKTFSSLSPDEQKKFADQWLLEKTQ